jgi:hypothetical protein
VVHYARLQNFGTTKRIIDRRIVSAETVTVKEPLGKIETLSDTPRVRILLFEKLSRAIKSHEGSFDNCFGMFSCFLKYMPILFMVMGSIADMSYFPKEP